MLQQIKKNVRINHNSLPGFCYSSKQGLMWPDVVSCETEFNFFCAFRGVANSQAVKTTRLHRYDYQIDFIFFLITLIFSADPRSQCYLLRLQAAQHTIYLLHYRQTINGVSYEEFKENIEQIERKIEALPNSRIHCLSNRRPKLDVLLAH